MFFVKVIVSGLFVAIVTDLAKKNPSLGGYIGAFPIVSSISIAWLAFGHQSSQEIAKFLQNALWGFIPSAVLLLTIVISLRVSANLITAVGIGIGVWLPFILIFEKIKP